VSSMAYCERTRTTLTILDRPRSTISGTPTKEKDWTLDALGNWPGYVTKTAGSTDLDQTRTNNAVNEITGISETTGTAWIDPAYDAAGNMTTIPKPANLTAGFTATYDAWNRLVKLVDGMNTVAEYEYDGLNQRIVKSIYVSGSLDHREHVYLNEQWQDLEIRKEIGGTEDTDPLEQYVWHPYYIDAIVLRDYDPETDGSATRYYYTQDANFNVTSVTNASGAVQERYQYTAYGQLVVLDADFSPDANGVTDITNPVMYTGRRFDDGTALFYYRNRYFHSQLGGFVSRDPIAYNGSQLNLLEYSRSNPLRAVDPFGLTPSGSVCIECHFRQIGGQGLRQTVKTRCDTGIASKCCYAVTPDDGYFSYPYGLEDWDICGASPDLVGPPPRRPKTSKTCYAAALVIGVGGQADPTPGNEALACCLCIIGAMASGYEGVVVGTEYNIVYARKEDIKQIDRICDELDLSREQRRMLHDEITKQCLQLDPNQACALCVFSCWDEKKQKPPVFFA